MASRRYSESRKRVQSVHDALKHDEPISDDDVAAAVDQFFVMTNTLQAAAELMWAVAPMCSRRKHFTNQFFSRVLCPLWMTDFRTEHVIAWIKAHLQADEPFGLRDGHTIDWIRAMSAERDLIDRLLIDVEEEQNYIWTQELRETLTPYSNIPMERIKFRYYWSDHVLDRSKLAIVFLCDDNELSRQTFRLLTKVISGIVSSNELSLFVTAYYFEFLETYQQFSGLFPLDQNPLQVVWFDSGNPVFHLSLSDLDENKMRENTLRLMSRSDE